MSLQKESYKCCQSKFRSRVSLKITGLFGNPPSILGSHWFTSFFGNLIDILERFEGRFRKVWDWEDPMFGKFKDEFISFLEFPRKCDVKIKMCGRKMRKRQRPNHWLWGGDKKPWQWLRLVEKASPMVGLIWKSYWLQVTQLLDFLRSEFLSFRLSGGGGTFDLLLLTFK